MAAETKKYITYIVFHRGKMVYVGEGLTDRLWHVHSGISTCMELNRIYFTDHVKPVVSIVARHETKAAAVACEKYILDTYKPEYNKIKLGKKINRGLHDAVRESLLQKSKSGLTIAQIADIHRTSEATVYRALRCLR